MIVSAGNMQLTVEQEQDLARILINGGGQLVFQSAKVNSMPSAEP